jgi:hypothetical protein
MTQPLLPTPDQAGARSPVPPPWALPESLTPALRLRPPSPARPPACPPRALPTLPADPLALLANLDVGPYHPTPRFCPPWPLPPAGPPGFHNAAFSGLFLPGPGASTLQATALQGLLCPHGVAQSQPGTCPLSPGPQLVHGCNSFRRTPGPSLLPGGQPKAKRVGNGCSCPRQRLWSPGDLTTARAPWPRPPPSRGPAWLCTGRGGT